MRLQATLDATYTPKTHAPDPDTAAVITLAAETGVTHVVERIEFSYNQTPTNGSLIVTVGGVAVKTLYVTSGGVGPMEVGPVYGKPGQAVVITLAAGGSGVSGSVNALVR